MTLIPIGMCVWHLLAFTFHGFENARFRLKRQAKTLVELVETSFGLPDQAIFEWVFVTRKESWFAMGFAVLALLNQRLENNTEPLSNYLDHNRGWAK